MSQDRTTITRAEAIRRRKEEEQKKRDKSTFKNVSTPKSTSAPQTSANPRKGWAPQATHSATPVSASRWQRRNDIAMSLPYSQNRGYQAPKTPGISISMPHISFGPRWISLLIVIICSTGLYFMLNLDPFIVHTAEISGNERINAEEIQSVLGIVDKPTAIIEPAQIEANILAAFPDISKVQIGVNFPNSVVISVTERIPVAAWQQNGQTEWVDALGYSFQPRGEIQGLPTVIANGAPPTPIVDPKQVGGPKPFLPADLSQAISTLSSQLPQDATMIFDPRYGLGWNDPKGWQVFFGRSLVDDNLKLKVYETMLAYLTKENIQPTMISVEYPNAPFYKVEQ